MRHLPPLAAVALAFGIAAAWALPVAPPHVLVSGPTLMNGDPMPDLMPQDLSGLWEITELAGAALVPEQPPTLEFRADDVGGFAGCNQYSVTLSVQDGNLVFGEPSMTRMACGEAAMAVEIAFIRALQRINAAALEPDGTLSLTGYGSPIMRAKRVE